MNLFELKQEYQLAAQKLQDMDLDDQTIADTLESFAGDLETKATNTVMVARNMRVTVNAIKDAAKAMIERSKAIENRADYLEKRVFETMLETGITKIECPYFRLSIKNNPPAVDVFDQAQLPQDYMREIPATHAPDKTLIAKALKDGYDVPGARLVQSQRLGVA